MGTDSEVRTGEPVGGDAAGVRTECAEAPVPRPPSTRAALVAIVGRANVGKSTLLNALLGEKVSIESPVAQTTRTVIRGILTEPRGQLAFLDTPGIHVARSDLGRLMNRTARAAVEGVDIVLLVLDVARPPLEEDIGWMQRLARRDSESVRVFVLNKCDLGTEHEQAYRDAWQEARSLAVGAVQEPEWVKISARTGWGLDALKDRLFALAPQQPWLFPPDVLTDYPKRLAIADIVREKLFLRLRDELPHRVATYTEELDETPGQRRATVVIYVERDSQKGIVIGEKGRMLRAVRRAAEAELETLYGEPVKLELIVRVEPKWTKNYFFLKRIGYVS